MKVIINNQEREVKVNKEGKTWVCKVGTASVYWRKGYANPYVIIPGVSLEKVNKFKPVIIEFLKEYKRIVLQHTEPKMSFEGEGQTNSPYKFKEQTTNNYVSSVPRWLREVKIKQVCSGPIRTFTRGIRIPQQFKSMAQKYMPYCSKCVYREDCNGACLTPEINSKDELLGEIENA